MLGVVISVFIFYFICFFKQKTAYDMRISDWSSDVCSSDLTRATPGEDPASCRLRPQALTGQVDRTGWHSEGGHRDRRMREPTIIETTTERTKARHGG